MFLRGCRLENLCYTVLMRAIRSSEIGSYLYCRRAWWYRKIGTPSENQAELVAGTELHRRHGRQVLVSALTRTLGWILLLAAILTLVAYLAYQVL
jgi:CRISPR/Cas system-associated exonuclease Cas4 (RecB family)